MYATGRIEGILSTMLKANQTATQWFPESDEDRALVRTELEAMLSSYHFRGSKRYPAFLRYVVNAALEGRGGELKERTLGVEVFGRDPDYDTNTDPVVRISASEVRKRIAQYYHENQEAARIRIELPLGSYAPEFLQGESAEPEPQGPQLLPMPLPEAKGKNGHLYLWTVAIVLALAGCAVGGYAYYRSVSKPGLTASDKLLAPLLISERPILIVVGTSHPPKVNPETPQTSFSEHTTGPYHHVSLATAIALANVAGILRQHGRAYEVKEDTETSLTDLRSRPLILIGATNNVWTMRLVGALRYRFLRDKLVQLQDTKNPQSTKWSINFSMPYANVARDFGMIARYHDSTTEGPVLVVAGVGPYGTEAASEYIASAEHMNELQAKMPAGWEQKDFQVVLQTDIIDNKAGPPAMIAETMW